MNEAAMASALIKFDEAAEQTSSEICSLLLSLPDSLKASATEIRLRIGQPVSVVSPDGIFLLDRWRCVSKAQLSDTFMHMCGNAVYSRQSEIAQGFLSLNGGHRVGLCGRAVRKGGETDNITELSSLCIRIAREITGCAEKIASLFLEQDGGLLLAGPPCSGKTTMLRDIALTVSAEHNTVIVDERGELAAVCCGVPQLRTGFCCDVLSGFGKAEGMLHAVRCLSPEIIICDEIGTPEEADAVIKAFNCGVKVAVSIHCGSAEELERRAQYKTLRDSGAFTSVVLLDRKLPGSVSKIIRL